MEALTALGKKTGATPAPLDSTRLGLAWLGLLPLMAGKVCRPVRETKTSAGLLLVAGSLRLCVAGFAGFALGSSWSWSDDDLKIGFGTGRILIFVRSYGEFAFGY